MPKCDLEGLSPDMQVAAQDVLDKLEEVFDPERPAQASRIASILVEFCAFETASKGKPGDAARLIKIASELDALSRHHA